jgi:hypothetical protein
VPRFIENASLEAQNRELTVRPLVYQMYIAQLGAELVHAEVAENARHVCKPIAIAPAQTASR